MEFILPNETAKNDQAAFESDAQIDPETGMLTLTYSVQQLKPQCPPNEWESYLAVQDVGHRFAMQKLVLEKE